MGLKTYVIFFVGILNACFLHSARAEMTEAVKIIDVNQSNQIPSPLQLDVHPGDVVSISADVVKTGGDCQVPAGCPENKPIEEFIWSSDGNPNTECNPGQNGDCLSNSGFQLHSDGVHYYVPYNMGPQIQITVRDNTVPNSTDVLALRNARTMANATPPTTVVTQPADYQYKEFNSNYALAGMGRWVVVMGDRYWVPYAHEADWIPYRHGYWTMVNGQGWTWVSYDPWGWYTDHYGIWRHHVTFGWVWSPFAEPVYHPATVTWVYTSGGIGWYPFFPGYVAGYRWGIERGFNDGFRPGISIGVAFHVPGFTIVANRDFLATNIAVVHPLVVGPREIGLARMGDRLGEGDLRAQRAWVEARAGHPVPITRTNTVMYGKLPMVHPVAVHPVPPRYQNMFSQNDLKRNVPVGSMMVRNDAKVAPRIVPPTTNNRGISPYRPNAPVRTKTQPIPNPEHPYAQRVKAMQIRKPILK
jgi:hypothetical protein